MSQYPARGAGQEVNELSVMPEVSDTSSQRPSFAREMTDVKLSGDGSEESKRSDDRLNPNRDSVMNGPSAYPEDSKAPLEEKRKLPSLEFHNGVGPFFASLGQRLKAVITRRLLLCIFIGQILSLCITSTSVVTTELGMNGWSLPATQTFFVYVALMAIYLPITLFKYGFSAWGKMLLTDGWKYFILACFDVFGNFTTVFGFRYTNLLSCLLINAWATPVSMVVTFFLLKARYHWTQLFGVAICIGGLVILVISDVRTGKDWGYTNKALGDGLMIVGATLYGLSNGFEEFLVRGRPLYEVVSSLGFFGFILNGILVAAYDRPSVTGADWSGRNGALIFAYVCAMCVLYTLAPLLFRFASAPFYNLSLMTSDFYSLCIGIALYQYRVYYLYPIAYAMVVIGLLIYFLSKSPEQHAAINVVARGKQAQKEAETGNSRVIGDPKGGFGSIV